MLYGALSLWVALKFWARYDPDPALYPAGALPPPMTDTEFTKWCVVRCFSCASDCVRALGAV